MSDNTEILLSYLKPGDSIMHTRCMGTISEHRFVEWSPNNKYLLGIATKETSMSGIESTRLADDISPRSVTHVNRRPVNLLEELQPEHFDDIITTIRKF